MKAAMSKTERVLSLTGEPRRGPRAKAETVLILGGTKEAAALAAELVAAHPNWRIISSLAGRTKEPKPVAGEVRIGGFGGPEGLAAYLRENDISLLVDMTHPFATQISANARKATEFSGIKLIAWQRPGWAKLDDDNWVEVETLAAAISAIPPNARVLLALGSQHIAPFAARPDVHFLIRMIDPPPAPLALPDHELLLARPGSVEEEFALLRAKHITHIICRNSGGKASYAKIAAARLLGLPVIIVTRAPGQANAASIDQIEQHILTSIG
jgi:precorrin-6A/cobalt-precorrin-6A reductase